MRSFRYIFPHLIVVGSLSVACSATIGGEPGAVDSGLFEPRDSGLLSIPDAKPQQPCIEGEARMEGADGTCYMLFYLAPQDWPGAQQQCLTLGATLTVVSDMAEQSIIAALAGQVPASTPDVWLGATDQATENSFLWVDGTPVDYNNWRSGEPNDGTPTGEDCVIIEGDLPDSTWDDRGCIGLFPYICERQSTN